MYQMFFSYTRFRCLSLTLTIIVIFYFNIAKDPCIVLKFFFSKIFKLSEIYRMTKASCNNWKTRKASLPYYCYAQLVAATRLS